MLTRKHKKTMAQASENRASTLLLLNVQGQRNPATQHNTIKSRGLLLCRILRLLTPLDQWERPSSTAVTNQSPCIQLLRPITSQRCFPPKPVGMWVSVDNLTKAVPPSVYLPSLLASNSFVCPFFYTHKNPSCQGILSERTILKRNEALWMNPNRLLQGVHVCGFAYTTASATCFARIRSKAN